MSKISHEDHCSSWYDSSTCDCACGEISGQDMKKKYVG